MFVIVWALSGNTIINSVYKPALSVIALAALVLLSVIRPTFSVRAFSIFLGFAAIIVGQVDSTGYISPVTIAGFFTNLTIAMSAVLLVRNSAKAYVDIMFWTAAISLPVYALLIASQGALAQWVVPFYLNPPDANILIHYFHPHHLRQNNSYYWEPGVFAGYLVLSLVFLGAIKSQYSPMRYKLVLFILVAALVTTFSTSGYLLGALALLYHTQAFGRSLVRPILISFGVIGVAVIFMNTSFLYSKISNEYIQVNSQQADWQLTRMGGMKSDWEQIKMQPFFGWGPNPEIRFQFVSENILKYQGNGLTDFTAKFGFCGLALFLTTTYMGFTCLFNGHGWRTLLALAITTLSLNGECFLIFPLYMMLMFQRTPVEVVHKRYRGRASSRVDLALNDPRRLVLSR